LGLLLGMVVPIRPGLPRHCPQVVHVMSFFTWLSVSMLYARASTAWHTSHTLHTYLLRLDMSDILPCIPYIHIMHNKHDIHGARGRVGLCFWLDARQAGDMTRLTSHFCMVLPQGPDAMHNARPLSASPPCLGAGKRLPIVATPPAMKCLTD